MPNIFATTPLAAMAVDMDPKLYTVESAHHV
jgi:hypothetical protein